MGKSYEELGLKDDFMFGIVMKNPAYCRAFLETTLGIRISHIEYITSQQGIDLSVDAKSVRLDVYVEDDEGTVYDVEMQTTARPNLPKRTRYYQGVIDLNILEKGEDYQCLRKSFIIFVCTFDMFGKGRHIYTFENRCVEDLDLPLGDGAVKIILNTKGTADDISPEMKRLLDFIDGKEPKDDFTKELGEAVKSVRKNEKRRLEYMTLEMRYREMYEDGREEGMKCGRTEGMERGLKLAKAALCLEREGFDAAEIADRLCVSEELVSQILDV